jgi:hypothetical protein
MTSKDKDIRVWVYLSNRLLSKEEQGGITRELKAFVAQWAAHGHQLQASAQILWNGLIVLAVDETVEPASGCSIDSSVNFIRSLGNRFNFNPFDRTVFAFLKDDLLHYAKLDDPQRAKGYNVLNLSVSNMESYKDKLLVPFEESPYANLAIDTSFKLSL